ncbi:hypothetical protein PoB_000730700 [Plakobranchus ocellatus]|uniref:Uncharacterized protein n=1 Tax=Plakobranchus ocellatus TaxID=259542 RepID=A0AAV3YEB4_9GAST|nr:hypothetical protein PoB_000730700 [Plakobranchus ocellatus]
MLSRERFYVRYLRKECIQESRKLINAAGQNGVATSNNFYAQIRHRQYPHLEIKIANAPICHGQYLPGMSKANAPVRRRQYPPTRDIKSQCSNPPSPISPTRDIKSQCSSPPSPITSPG